ncbi:unnamed protein product, partial [Iphiclides podalirius]
MDSVKFSYCNKKTMLSIERWPRADLRPPVARFCGRSPMQSARSHCARLVNGERNAYRICSCVATAYTADFGGAE